MDVPRLLLAAVVCLAFTGPAALAQDDEEIVAQSARVKGPIKPWKQVRGFGRVLDLRTLPVVIDEPGLYAIDRNWQLSQSAVSVYPEPIKITADNVTLDLHSYEISTRVNAPPLSTLLVISGHGVEVRNGTLSACCDGASAVRSTTGAWLHHLTLASSAPMEFEGRGARLTDSEINTVVAVSFAGLSVVRRNTMSCRVGCVAVLGDGTEVIDNKLYPSQGGGIEIVGNNNILANNVADVSSAPDVSEVFEIKGDSNVVRDNIVLLGGEVQTLFAVSGAANTLEGNIAGPPAEGLRGGVGIRFATDGNYYGNNRMAPTVPFALNGTTQIDWGGNVGY
jgi:hypothetical protein